MLVHFIQVIDDAPPERLTTFKTIPINQDLITVYWSRPFHMIFVEIFNHNYYLVVVQQTYNRSTTISKTINPSDRCEHISELFNETIVQLHLVRLIKYYQLPCRQKRSNHPLSCFYDDIHICLCEKYGHQYLANCIEFEHEMKFDCSGQSGCENGARCFQDSPNCAQTSICVCPKCFYGKRCQFSTSNFGLSLDAILGYHILPHVNLLHQTFAVKISMTLTTVMFIAGVINGILSLITFNNKKLWEVGCGFYLLGSSVTTLLTMIIFTLKFWILICTQMGLVVNRLFLHVQCISIDFLLRVSLSIDQWLNAFVAAERAIATIRGVNFNKKSSQRVPKVVILVLIFVSVATAIHDPIYRQLMNDEDDDEKRIWCIVTYPPSVQVFNATIQALHFLVPFIMNVISAIVIITTTARRRASVQTQQTYREHLVDQFWQHKHLLISPFVLVILAFPRLIISFVSGCMKSAHESWLYLAGYFISLIPPMLTFVVFVIPSTLYQEEFRTTVRRYRTTIQTRLCCI
ncbi:unnamed protein product [Rotaria sp. Silwood2]|nr:unnamed protein product [Rotaria sp. Silwood2]CAF3440549.1 unnamed protein product [Rotaria sp. Silwood2]CAF4488678.1 unnamed protein product [Rotaria sp. Silwood2]CAF4564021.1 unnamed protein product [Rotaria sp. Silwood2]